MERNHIIVTDRDLDRLSQLLSHQASAAAEELEAELARAQVVPQREVPRDIVTMNSDVLYEDTTQAEQRQIRLVYPSHADLERGWISVLAPLGSALLGLRVGQTIEWRMPRGVRRLKVVGVPYQPEASGDFTL